MSDVRPSLDEEQEFYRLLWYGNPGKGKTTAISHAAVQAAEVGAKVIYIDADNGLKAKALHRLGIPTHPIEPYRDVTYKGLAALHEQVGNRLADGEAIFAVAWDTTTKTASVQLELIADAAYVANENKPANARKQRGEHDVWVDDYGVLAQQMRKLLRRYHDLPVHLLIGCHERRDIDEDTGMVSIGPAMSPAVVQDFAGYMDVMIQCRSEVFDDDPKLAAQDGEEFTGLTRPAGRFFAKDRFGLLPKVLVNPTFDRVAAYLNGTLVKEDDKLQLEAKQRRQAKAKAEADKPAEEPSEETE